MDGWQTQVITSPETEVSTGVKLTVLLPAYNEEAAIGGVLEEIVESLSRDDAPRYEILVVDDGSTDRTAELAEAFARTCWQCSVRVMRRPSRGGAGAARKDGIRRAEGQIVVMLDADGTYPAGAINDLLPHFPAYDQVNGARTSEQGSLPWLRRPAKWFLRKLACYLTGHRIPDLNTGLKAFKRDAMLPWLWVVPDGFSCVTTMTLAFLTNGYAVKYVPIGYRTRIGRSKFHPIKDTLSYLSTILRMVLYFRPLKVFLPVAAAVIALSSLLAFTALRGCIRTGWRKPFAAAAAPPTETEAKGTETEGPTQRTVLGRTAATLVILIGYALLLQYMHFLVLTTVFLAVLFVVLGQRSWWRVAMIAVLGGAGFYALFIWGLNLPV